MTETVRFSKLGKEDLLLNPRNGTMEVTLSDGRVALISAVDIAYLLSDAVAKANLPAAGIAGRLQRVTDDVGGLWMDQGTSWFSLGGEIVNVQDAPFNVHPNRTAAQNSVGLLAALATGKSVYVPPGTYSYDTVLPIVANGQQLFGAGQGLTTLTYTGTGFGITLGTATEVRLLRVAHLYLAGNNRSTGGIQLGPNAIVSGATVENCRISGFTATGAAAIVLRGTVGANLHHLFLEGNRSGIIDTTAAVTTTTRCRSVWIQGSTDKGIYLRRAQGFWFSQGIVEGSAAEAIKLDAVTSSIDQVAITDSWFENNNTSSGTYTMEVTGAGAGVASLNVTIRGGRWEVNAGKAHVYCDQAADVVIERIWTIGDAAPVTITVNAARVLVLYHPGVNQATLSNLSTTSQIHQMQHRGLDPEVYQFSGKLQVDKNLYTVVWTDYSATTTVTGFSVFTTKVVYYKRVGRLVFVWYAIRGTSNATTFTFTLPITPKSLYSYGHRMPVYGEDAGSALASPAALEWNNTTTVTLYGNLAAAAWTGSGVKASIGSFVYEADGD